MIDFCFIVYMSFETLNKNKYRFRSLYPFSDKELVIYGCFNYLLLARETRRLKLNTNVQYIKHL